MSRYAALIIDDEPDIRALIALTLQRMDLDCFQAANVAEAMHLLGERAYHFCITDMKLPDGNGLDLIRVCNARYPDMPVAMITAYGNMELGVTALKAGAFDVVAKPLDNERLRELVKAAIRLTRVPANIDSLPSGITLLGHSAGMTQLKETLFKVARTQAPVCLQGGPGSGKELAARLIHLQSARSEAPLVIINCGAQAAERLEFSLFGSPLDEGAINKAHGGTLLLEEIDQLSAELQTRLLRVIQEGNVRNPVTDEQVTTDIRLLCASEKNLSQLVQQEKFRQDLFFRINVVQVDIPALSERQEDIPLLVKHFIRKYTAEWDMPEMRLDTDAMDALYEYDFPGNVRELESILQRAVTLAEGDIISRSDLQLHQHVASNDYIDDKIETNNLEAYLENIERRAITQALEATRWNKTAAAEKLGISFRALRYRCKKLNID